jgi:bile acid:Na+ symporter, BASS family
MFLSSYSLLDVLLSLTLAFIMFSVGMSLTVGNFRELFHNPRSLLIGLIAQIIVLPVIAYVIAYFSDLSLPLKVGLIIVASCPGGTTSGVITYFFKGNVALSITFTSLNSIITLFTIPFIVNLSLLIFYGHSSIIHLSYTETILQIFMITIIPALAGVWIRSHMPDFAERARKPLKALLVVALAVIFTLLFLTGKKSGGTGISKEEIFHILPYALLLNILCTIAGLFMGKIFKLGIRDSYTIGVEASVHNTTLAFLVAGTLLHEPDMVKPALIYAMFSFWTAVLYSIVVKKICKTGVFVEFSTKQ